MLKAIHPTDSAKPAVAVATLPSHATPPDRKYLLERVDEAAVVQLYADGFVGAPARPEDAASGTSTRRHWPAATSTTTSDTRTTSRCATILEEIITHSGDVDTATLAEITRYTKLFWLNTGPYNNLTARKFVLQVPARGVRSRGAALPRMPARRFRCKAGETLDAHAGRGCEPLFFDPAVDPIVTNKTPGAGQGHPERRARTTCTSA